MNRLLICKKIEKVLRSLTANFDYFIVSIKESKNLADIKVDEIQALLEARDMRLKKRNSEREKVAEQTLRARFIKNYGRENAKQRNNLTNDAKSSKNSKNHSDSTMKGMGNEYSWNKIDMKEVHCYNYQGFGHYARY